MKRLLAILCLVLALMLVFVACEEEESSSSSSSSTDLAEPNVYTIKWFDENGTLLSSKSVEEGTVPSYTYTVADTTEWDYTFNGWATSATGEIISSIPVASADASYYAIVTKAKQKYTVTFDSNGGSAVASQTVEYGSTATEPQAPTYQGYKFVGWSTSAQGTDSITFQEQITGNVTYYAIWNEVLNVKSLLSSLLNGYSFNPFSYIPESMRMDYSANLIDPDDIVNDYSSAVNVSSIKYGHGEQWHMILDNLEQSKLFFNALSVVETITTVSITTFNNYFDKNPADTASHSFKTGIYNVTIDFDGEILYYVLDYTATLPVLGEQSVQICMSMLAETGEKVVRVQIGDANALTYKILENSYEFAIKYLGVRRAMFSIEEDENGAISGKIYEYLTASSVEIGSAADFFISNDYVLAVGNKASGMIGFKNFIAELYDAKNGQLLAYEVEETLSSIVYNTLWFNLDDVDGINSIKYQEANGNDEAEIFINGSSTQWKTKKVGSGIKMLSRRFDIEFRTQFLYSYDQATEKYTVHQVSVPMIFVQEENYDTFVDDVESTNNIEITNTIKSVALNALLNYYDVALPPFKAHKDSITSEIIVAYIGNKKTFN